MRILVTGGAGFIGSHISDAYIKEGHDVFVIDNLSTGSTDNINPKAKFYRIDVREGISSLISDIRPEIINHNAGQISTRDSVRNPLLDAEINISGTINLVEAGVKAGIKKFIFASSGGGIYGEQDYFPADEKHPVRPLSPYGISKRACEQYLSYYKRSFGLDYVAFRYSNVYGPRQSPFGEAGVISIFAMRLIKGETPVITGDGLQTRDFVYIEDVVRANVLALDTHCSGEINISTATETPIKDLLFKLAAISGKRTEILYGPARQGEQKRSCLSYERAREIFGWKPSVFLEDGLSRTVRWAFENAGSWAS